MLAYNMPGPHYLTVSSNTAMTRKQLRKTLISVIVLYALAFVSGLVIYYFIDNTDKHIHYQIFKDLIPLIIAIPAAYLGFCFQRRSSFLQALRILWSNLINAVNSGIQYTHQKETTDRQFGETLVLLSKVIDEFRGVYKNINESHGEIGIFPFECLKEIHKTVSRLGYGTLDAGKATEARKHIRQNWGNLRRSFLTEFDRSKPTVFDTPYVDN